MTFEEKHSITVEEKYTSKERASFIYAWLNDKEREELHFYSKKIRDLMDKALERAEKSINKP